jgi:CheY-specific phosphatase CheX
MSVKFFGQFLIDQGEIDAGHLREALDLMDRENKLLGQIAIDRGFMKADDVERINGTQRTRDVTFGDLAVEMGLLDSRQLVDIVRRQRSQRLPIGQALVRLGYLSSDRLGILLDAFKSDQSPYSASCMPLPDALTNHRASRFILELLPRFMLRVAHMEAKIGDIRVFDRPPTFAHVRVSVPIRGTRGLDVALVSDLDFAEAVAAAATGLASKDLDLEMVTDGVGEFLNVLVGNAVSAIAKEGVRVELGPPDYEAELCDGWIVDLAVARGRAAMVLSVF